MPLRKGETLKGRFFIQARMRSGGMGAVWRAWDGNLRIPVVIKENLLRSIEAESQFALEARLPAKLKHKNLPGVLDYFELPGQGQYIVMEYIEGQDLAQALVASGVLLQEQALYCIGPVLEALAFLHERRPPIIHRDVKPANIRVTPDGEVFLVDFGLVRVADPQDPKTVGLSAMTPGYASPEQSRSEPVDARSDVYSAGATLYALLTGEPPSADEIAAGLMRTSIDGPLAPEVWDAMVQAVQRDPADRFQTANGFLAALRSAPVVWQQFRSPPSKLDEPTLANPNSPAWRSGSGSCSPQTRPRLSLRPYTLVRGAVVTDPAQLPRVCVAHWAEAVTQFHAGDLERWLRAGVELLRTDFQIGPANELEKLADQAAAIADRTRRGDAIDRSAGMGEFLELLGAPPAQLALDHESVDFGRVQLGETVEVSLGIRNPGGSYLRGSIQSIAADLPVFHRFGVRAGATEEISLQFCTKSLPEGPIARDSALVVASNVGEAKLGVRGWVVGPDLEVQPEHVSLGTVNVDEPEAGFSAGVTVRNVGSSALSVQTVIEAPWLTAEPARFECQAGKSRSVRLALASEPQLKAGDHLQVVRFKSLGGSAEVTVSLRVSSSLEPGMIHVPAGEFLMGCAESDEDAWPDQQPQHQVVLSEYWIGRSPVTNAQYGAFIRATGHPIPSSWADEHPPSDKLAHPVTGVNWHDAVAYCCWLADTTGQPYRLPTEAEWEKAARGTDGRTYPWIGEWAPQKCNTEEGGHNSTTAVGSFSPDGDSPYGCTDMAGNVWEWVADWYDSGYYSKSPGRDPQGPSEGTCRVLRGGSWANNRQAARSAKRHSWDPVRPENYAGFRCCLSATPVCK